MTDTYHFPNQPIHLDIHGVQRFTPNRMVQYLFDHGGLDMNDLIKASLAWPDDERAHFAQLIGYSVDGWESLSYVSEARARSVETAVLDPAIAYSQGYLAGIEEAIKKLGFLLTGEET